MTKLCDFGMVGLAVMGENLALNVESRGYAVAVFNRTTSKVDEFMQGRGRGKNFVGCHSIQELVQSLARPRKVMLMVKAGPAVDAFIDQLIPLMEPGDVIIDGGNTHFAETDAAPPTSNPNDCSTWARASPAARKAPPGPQHDARRQRQGRPLVKPIFQAIAAKSGPRATSLAASGSAPAGRAIT